MAKAPTTKPARVARVTASASAPGELTAIRILVGQEGPEVSRVRGDELAIGVDIDADEAQRLIDAEFAERV